MSIFIDNIKIRKAKKVDYIEKVKKKLAVASELIDMGLINLYL